MQTVFLLLLAITSANERQNESYKQVEGNLVCTDTQESVTQPKTLDEIKLIIQSLTQETFTLERTDEIAALVSDHFEFKNYRRSILRWKMTKLFDSYKKSICLCEEDTEKEKEALTEAKENLLSFLDKNNLTSFMYN